MGQLRVLVQESGQSGLCGIRLNLVEQLKQVLRHHTTLWMKQSLSHSKELHGVCNKCLIDC